MDINKSFRKEKLGNVMTLHRGFDLPIEKLVMGEYPVVFSNGRIEYHRHFKLKGPGVVTGRSGTLGNTFYIDKNYWPHNTTLFVSDFHNNNPKYVYYLLKSIRLDNLNAGTGVPTLNRNHAHEIFIDYTSEEHKQKQIVEILSSLDEKIELNNKTAIGLEKIVQAIYNEWFDKFSHADEVLPSGWERKELGDVCGTFGGGTPATGNSSFWEGGNIKWATPTDVTATPGIFLEHTERKITQAGLSNSSTRLLPANTILLTSRATVGLIRITKTSLCTNQGFISLVPKNISHYYIYQTLLNKVKKIKSLAEGSTFPEISRGVFRKIEIVVPDKETEHKYVAIVEPIFGLIYSISNENRKLENLKQTLLPKLLKGELI